MRTRKTSQIPNGARRRHTPTPARKGKPGDKKARSGEVSGFIPFPVGHTGNAPPAALI